MAQAHTQDTQQKGRTEATEQRGLARRESAFRPPALPFASPFAFMRRFMDDLDHFFGADPFLLGDRLPNLCDGLAGDVGGDERVVLDVLGLLVFEHSQHRGGGRLAELGIHGPKHGIRIHHDFAGRQRDQGPAGHRVVRHEYGDLCAVVLERMGDLSGGEHEAAGRVDDQVDRALRIGQLDGARHLLGVVDVDVAEPSYLTFWISSSITAE